MSRDESLYLEDIIEGCTRIAQYTDGMDYLSFCHDRKTVDAVLRNLEIIGEAVKNVPMLLRERHDYIPWRRIAGLRDILAHTYFAVDDEMIWDIVQNEVPPLKRQIERILGAI